MKTVKLYDLLKMKKVIVSTLGDNLIWTDEDIFKDFAIRCLIDGLSDDEKEDALNFYSKKSAEWFVNSKDTVSSYKIINPQDVFKVSNDYNIPMRTSGNEMEFLECTIEDIEDMFYSNDLLDGIPLSFDEKFDNVIVTYSTWDEPMFDITYDELYN